MASETNYKPGNGEKSGLFNVSFNGKSCLDVGLLVKTRPNIPAPEPIYDPIVIPGRDGVLMPGDIRYDPLIIDVEFNFMTPAANLWADAYRRARKWLHGPGNLQMSDDEDFFYKVYMVSIIDSERTSKRIGEFTASFYCDPWQYYNAGAKEYAAEDAKINPGAVSHPIYHVIASGDFTLTVNGSKFSGNGETYIDTDLMLAYNSNKEVVNSQTIGDFDSLYLQEGTNNFSISGGELYITPRWRVY